MSMVGIYLSIEDIPFLLITVSCDRREVFNRVDEFYYEKWNRNSERLTTRTFVVLDDVQTVRVPFIYSNPTDILHKLDNCLVLIKRTPEDLWCAPFCLLPYLITNFILEKYKLKLTWFSSVVKYGTFQMLLRIDLTP